MGKRILKHIGWFWLRVLIIFLCALLGYYAATAQVKIDTVRATITKYSINYGDTTKEVIPYATLIAVSEADSTFLLGNRPYRIQEIIVDSVVTYIAKDTPYKEFVYNETNSTLTQKNIRFRDSHKNETWFEYKYILPKNENEFEF